MSMLIGMISSFAQNVGIGTTVPAEKLEVNGAIKIGTTNGTNAGTIRWAGNHLQVYNSSFGWITLDSISQYGWSKSGNAGTNSSLHFLGTIDNNSMVFKTNNIERVRFDNVGNVGIGTTTPAHKLDVNGNINLSDTSNLRIGGIRVLSTIGNNNTFLGDNSGNSNTTGYSNTANGAYSLYSNTTGIRNTASGYSSLRSKTTGNYNVATGGVALYSNTTGSDNTATGTASLLANTTGDYNTANGAYSLRSNTTGNYNTANGTDALYSNTTGFQNTAFGESSLVSNTTGYFNTAIGTKSNAYSTSSIQNTCLGAYSGTVYANGDNNTFIGYYARANAAAYTNSTALGANLVITASHQVRIGSASVTSIGGQVAWSTLSDGRFKTIVNEKVKGLEFILKLNPITYRFDANTFNQYIGQTNNEINLDATQLVRSGFIAQEVEAAANACGYSFSGIDKPKNEKDYYGLRYAEFTVPLVKAVQELNAENTLLKTKLSKQEEEVKLLKDEIMKIKSTLSAQMGK